LFLFDLLFDLTDLIDLTYLTYLFYLIELVSQSGGLGLESAYAYM